MDFKKKLSQIWSKNNSLLCVGLDPDITKIPKSVTNQSDPLFKFNKAIIDATADLVCAFKPNSAFYEAYGADGIRQLHDTTHYIKKKYPHIPVLLDYKRGDIGNTNNCYALFAFEYLGVDAITISPYLGKEANKSFLDYKDKGILVLCRTSNPGAGEFQDLESAGGKLFEVVANRVMNDWDDNNNCGLVIGSPYPEELSIIRKKLGNEVIFLVPGAGPQGGDIEKTVRAGINDQKTGLIINSSREVIYALNTEDFAEASRKKAISLRDEINIHR